MDKLEEYKIPILSLEDGIHEFKFVAGKKFMELMKSDEDFKGSLDINLKLDKLNRTYTMDFHINGSLIFPCDRCLDDVKIDIDESKKVFAKVRNGVDDGSDGEIIWLSEDKYEYNISKILYEFIVLSLPMKRVHPDDSDGNPTCNEDILDKIEDINSQKGHDPRWDALNKLKDK